MDLEDVMVTSAKSGLGIDKILPVRARSLFRVVSFLPPHLCACLFTVFCVLFFHQVMNEQVHTIVYTFKNNDPTHGGPPQAVIERIPPPPGDAAAPLRCRLVDSWYDETRGESARHMEHVEWDISLRGKEGGPGALVLFLLPSSSSFKSH